MTDPYVIALPDAIREARAKRPAILNLIGDTPLVPIERMNPNPNVKLYAKLESFNPGGSVKDRIGLWMIEAAERDGTLKPGHTILEPTSGNTGIGLAMVAAIKGYRIVLAMSEGVSIERRKILAAFGAEFLLTPADEGTDGAIELAYELAGKEPERYFLADQYNNPANPLAHYYGTSLEIWRQTKGQITHFVATMGTTGTLMGCGRRLHELNPDVKIVGVEPYLGHKLQGLKNLKEAYVPGNYDRSILDEKVNVEDEVAFETTRRLAREEGLLVGMSAGGAMAVALQKAEQLESGTVVALLPDGGERYLSTPLFQVTQDIEPDSKLSFLNSLTRKMEPFRPIERGRARMYTCGPTAHALPHIGLYRRILIADMVRRTLEYDGYEVEEVMNITDIDDKTIAAAEASDTPLKELTQRHIAEFKEDLETLNVLPPTKMPLASEHVDDMVATTRRLVGLGYAYEKHRSVYFDVGSFPLYGKLSGADLEKIKLGATVDLDSYEKSDPRDFTLLKRSSLDEIRKGICYRTEWGNVRPGWHIECAAITLRFFGDRYDIHVGGNDLVFPHHENEIAVCHSLTGRQPASYWLHSATVTRDGRKMSHSQGNAVSVRELLAEGYRGRELRFYLLGNHYRQPFHFSRAALDAAVQSLRRLDSVVHRLHHVSGRGLRDKTDDALAQLRTDFTAALYDDLNVSAAQAALFHFVRWANRQIDRNRLDEDDAQRILATLESIDRVLGVGIPAAPSNDLEVEGLLEQREVARQEGDYGRADAIRQELETRGVVVRDTPDGPTWRREE